MGQSSRDLYSRDINPRVNPLEFYCCSSYFLTVFFFPEKTMLAWYIFLHPFTFNLYVSLYTKWISYRQHAVGSCFLIPSGNFCLLIGAFRPMMFKVISNITTIFVTVCCPCWIFFLSIFVFHFLSASHGFNWAFYIILS